MAGQSHTATLNGIQMYYEVHGDGPPLVLLHGFFVSSAVWERYIPGFGQHFRLIIPDLRGHGRSTNAANEFTHRQSALDIFALLDQLGVEQFQAVGLSSGGMTLLHMATGQPDRLEAMILVGATSCFVAETRARQRDRTVEGLLSEDWERLRRHHRHGDAQIRSLVEQFHDFADSYDDMNFTAPYLSTIQARTLIVHGDRDEYFPVAIPVEMYQAIPRSYLWIVPNGEHMPVLSDVDRLGGFFTETALAFLRDEWE